MLLTLCLCTWVKTLAHHCNVLHSLSHANKHNTHIVAADKAISACLGDQYSIDLKAAPPECDMLNDTGIRNVGGDHAVKIPT